MIKFRTPLSLKLEYINIETFIWSICMNESFYTGKGIGVAILDTGIYPHIDFDSRICAFADLLHIKKFHMTTMDMEPV